MTWHQVILFGHVESVSQRRGQSAFLNTRITAAYKNQNVTLTTGKMKKNTTVFPFTRIRTIVQTHLLRKGRWEGGDGGDGDRALEKRELPVMNCEEQDNTDAYPGEINCRKGPLNKINCGTRSLNCKEKKKERREAKSERDRKSVV